MLENTLDNLKENGLEVEEVLADTGYSSVKNFEILESHNLTGYFSVPTPREASPTGDFQYDPLHDRYVCPKGFFVTNRYIKTRPNGKRIIYRTSKKDCRNCPLKPTCCLKSDFKQLERNLGNELTEKMRERMKTAIGRKMKGIRSATVEPVIGTLTSYMGMGQINSKGIKQANKCMLMAAAAYNLKKLLKFATGTAIPNIATAIKGKTKGIKHLIYEVDNNIFHKMSMNDRRDAKSFHFKYLLNVNAIQNLIGFQTIRSEIP